MFWRHMLPVLPASDLNSVQDRHSGISWIPMHLIVCHCDLATSMVDVRVSVTFRVGDSVEFLLLIAWLVMQFGNREQTCSVSSF